MPVKRCLGECGQTKSILSFYVDRSRPDGHMRECKMCRRRSVAWWTSMRPRL